MNVKTLIILALILAAGALLAAWISYKVGERQARKRGSIEERFARVRASIRAQEGVDAEAYLGAVLEQLPSPTQPARRRARDVLPERRPGEGLSIGFSSLNHLDD